MWESCSVSEDAFLTRRAALCRLEAIDGGRELRRRRRQRIRG